MEENHNDITKLSVSVPEAVDTEKPESAGAPANPDTAAKPELKKPAFLEEKKPEPYKKIKLSFLDSLKQEAPEEGHPDSTEEVHPEEAAEVPAAEPAAESEVPAAEAEVPAAETEVPAAEPAAETEGTATEAAEPAAEAEVPAADADIPASEPAAEIISPTSHVSWNTDELPVIEDVLGIEEPEESASAEGEPASAEGESASAEEEISPAEEESPAAAEDTDSEKPASHADWDTDELPVIEDVLDIEEKAEEAASEKEEEKKAASGGFHIPLLGREKNEKEETEEAEETEEEASEDEESAEEEEDKGKFTLKMPSGSVKRILIAGVVILAIILIYSIIQSRRVYNSYEVMSAVVSSDDASNSYQVVKYGMIRYSNNGIALTDKSGNVIWNQTYEMNNPIIATAGNYIAAGDRGASTLYIFNQFGQCGKLTTDLPLQGIQMAENGVVAAILSDSESNYINLYDKQGNRLVGIRATLENTGYPLAVGVSPDASKVVVSYLTVSESAKTQTKLVFYDFGTVNGEHEKLTGVLDGLCPKIRFLGQQRVAVFREKGFDIYSVDGEVKMVFSTGFEDEIRSIFSSAQKLGFIFRNRDDNGKYRIELYDVSGQKSMTIYSDLDYTDLSADSDEVVLYNTSRAEIYKYNGKQVFGGDFENRITSIMPSWDAGMYWLVEDSRLSEIRVK